MSHVLPGHIFYTMANRIQIGTLVSARVGPFEPSLSPQGRPLRARIQGKVLGSSGTRERVVEWSNGYITRHQANAMRIESPPPTTDSSRNPVSGTVATTEVVDNGHQGANTNPAGAGPSVARGSAATPVSPSAPSGAPCAVGPVGSGSTPVPSSGGSTAPPTILSVAPSSATNVSDIDSIVSEEQNDLLNDSDDGDDIPIEPDVRAEQVQADREALHRLLGVTTTVTNGNAKWIVMDPRGCVF